MFEEPWQAQTELPLQRMIERFDRGIFNHAAVKIGLEEELPVRAPGIVYAELAEYNLRLDAVFEQTVISWKSDSSQAVAL